MSGSKYLLTGPTPRFTWTHTRMSTQLWRYPFHRNFSLVMAIKSAEWESCNLTSSECGNSRHFLRFPSVNCRNFAVIVPSKTRFPSVARCSYPFFSFYISFNTVNPTVCTFIYPCIYRCIYPPSIPPSIPPSVPISILTSAHPVASDDRTMIGRSLYRFSPTRTIRGSSLTCNDMFTLAV